MASIEIQTANHGLPAELALFLACAGIIVPLFQKLRISPVLGFLLAGLAVGPAGLSRLFEPGGIGDWLVIRDVAEVRHIAEFGVAFLLFIIGLELSPVRLWSMRRLVLGLGGLQVALTAVALGGLAWIFGNGLSAAAVLGACLSLSSTAMVLQLLTERGKLGSEAGRAAFAVLLLQDLAVVPILFAVGLLVAGQSGADEPDTVAALLKAGLAIAAIVIVGRYVLTRVFRLAGGTRSPDVFMAATLLVVLGISAMTAAAGLSMALGAFLAGLVLAESEYRHEVAVVIEPFKGLLLGLFFMSVGMGLDPTAVGDWAIWILPSIAGLVLIKAAIAFGLARAFGVGIPAAAEMALLIGPAGEFAFVVIGLAQAGAVLSEAVAQFMLTVAGASMFLTPVMAAIGQRIATYLASRAAPPTDRSWAADVPDLEGHYVLAGFGRVGRLLHDVLRAEALPCLAVDRDAATVARMRKEVADVYFGDAARPEFLEKLGLNRAQALVVTLNDFAGTERIVKTARRLWPKLPIFARARDEAHARRLLEIGATGVVPEALEAGLELAEIALRGGGYPAEAARATVHRRRLVALENLNRDISRPPRRGGDA